MSIQIALASTDPLLAAADLLVLGVPEGASSKTGPLGALHAKLGKALAAVLQREEFIGKKDHAVDLWTQGAIKPARVLLVGLGKQAPGPVEVRALAARGARFAQGMKAASLALVLPAESDAAARAAAEGVVLGAYRFTRYLTGERVPKVGLGKATLFTAATPSKKVRDAAKLGAEVGQAVTIARDLINEPPNELYPAVLAKRAQEVARASGLKCTVMNAAALKKAGMKLFVAVGQGSAHEPHMAHLVYTPKGVRNPKKLVFVGKGLTFDTGGICIKPAPGMEEMKGDMGGAANVIALMAAVAAVKPNVEVHGLIGCAENMPDGAAYRPGDIFGSLDGKTVEIINTDAEGRLVLADVLAYGAALKPDLMIDNATLTGACVVALGTTVSGFYSNRDESAELMKKAAREAGEAMWHMPLVEELREGLKSDWADLKHTADRWGGSITAALFLREFVSNVPWVHVDIAGPSMANKPYGIYSKGGTGHGVLAFLHLVETFGAR